MSETNTGVALEVAAVSVGNKAMTGGGIAAAAGWLAQINWVGLIGSAVAILGFLASVYFQHRRDRRDTRERETREKRAAEMHEAKMKALRDRCEP